MNSLEELSAKLAKEVSPDGWLCGPDAVEEYTRLLVAALGAQEPVGEILHNPGGCYEGSPIPAAPYDYAEFSIAMPPPGTKLFAAPVLPSVPEPVAYLHYAAKKPSLRELSFSAEPNALQIAAGWKSKPLFAAAPSPQEDVP